MSQLFVKCKQVYIVRTHDSECGPYWQPAVIKQHSLYCRISRPDTSAHITISVDFSHVSMDKVDQNSEETVGGGLWGTSRLFSGDRLTGALCATWRGRWWPRSVHYRLRKLLWGAAQSHQGLSFVIQTITTGHKQQEEGFQGWQQRGDEESTGGNLTWKSKRLRRTIGGRRGGKPSITTRGRSGVAWGPSLAFHGLAAEELRAVCT